MAISSTTTKNSASANGTQHSFPYSFKIFADGDLTVIVRSANGTETVKALNTDYIVTNAGNANGGNVLFKFNTGNSNDAHFSSSDKRPQSGETVLIRRNLTLTQGTDYVENDPFPAESHENALDRITMIAQQLQEAIDRSLKISRTNTMTSTEFTVGATDRANKILSFDSTGELTITTAIGTSRGNWAASTAYAERDIVKDTSTNNIFIVNTAHTSSGSQPLTTNANSAKYTLLVDAATATTASADAQKLAINAEDSQFTLSGGTQGFSALHYAAKAAASANSAATATVNVQLAEDFATKTTGEVVAGTGKFSSEAHALGGTGVTDQVGASKEWAIDPGTVDSSGEFSSKSYAVSGSTINAGSAKNWALGGGDSFATNTTIGNTGLYSAKYYAEQAAASKASFDNVYLGASSSDPTQDLDGSALEAGDLYYNSSDQKLKFYNGSSWVSVETGASAGFAIAMAVAL